MHLVLCAQAGRLLELSLPWVFGLGLGALGPSSRLRGLDQGDFSEGDFYCSRQNKEIANLTCPLVNIIRLPKINNPRQEASSVGSNLQGWSLGEIPTSSVKSGWLK